MTFIVFVTCFYKYTAIRFVEFDDAQVRKWIPCACVLRTCLRVWVWSDANKGAC